MSPSRILIGQFLIVLAIIVLTLWGATQWTAHALGHQPALGRPWFFAAETPVYKPWRLFQWWYAYEAYAPGVFARGGAMAASGGVFGILAAVIGSVWRSRWEKRVTTYGSARWAEEADLKKAGLLQTDGVFLGRWKDQYLRHAGPEHVLAVAPTRSGKGVGLVVPTLLSWTGSAIIHDIKGENWALTSGWRAALGPCLQFNPVDPGAARFNPLSEVRLGLNEVRDVENIADILVDPEGSLVKRNHWELAAHEFLVGIILHVLYAEDNKTLAGCAQFLSDPSRRFAETLQTMMNTPHVNGVAVHAVVARAANDMVNKSENERSGVLSTTLTLLSMYSDPIIEAVTSKSDFAIADLIAGDRPISLYLVVPPSDLSRTKPLVRLLLNQIARRLTETLPKNDARQVLFMMDEFPQLGRLDFFESALAFLAGYGVRAFLIAQSLNQIEKAYGPNHSILDNCHVRVAFAANDERTAKRVSDALGMKTELRSQKNYTGHRLAPWLSHMMVSRQETQRPLMTPGEILQMSDKRQLVMVSGMPPLQADKLRYYEDANFTERVLPAFAPPPRDDPPSPLMSPGEAGPVARDRQEGGRSLTLPLEPPGAERDQDVEPEQALEPNQSPDAAGDQTLETLRRAAALDLSDPDTLPDF